MTGTASTLPPDKIIAGMLTDVLSAFDELGAIYTLGGESLIGYAEGDLTKYKFDIHLYLFQLSALKKIKLFFKLYSEGIILKPKRVKGSGRFKLRIRRKKGDKKHPYVLYIIPVKMNGNESIVHAGGHTNKYDYKDLNPNQLQIVKVENTSIAIPQDLNSFVQKYKKQLLAESYKRHPFQFTEKNRGYSHKLLRRSCEILEELGIHYWLDFGTLLGIIRENKLIDWDKDMDLSVRFESEAQMEQMVKALSKIYPVKTLAPSIRPGAWNMGKYRTIKAFHQKFGMFRTDPHLDFFTQYRGKYDNNTEFTYRSVIAGVNNEIPASYVDKLDKIVFDGHEYSIPNNVEEFLALRYGEDWKTPKQYWHPAYDDQSMVKPD